jgi:hypothetical protein
VILSLAPQPAALRDFNPGFDRFGSLATNRPARDAGGMSALTQKRPFAIKLQICR